MRRVHPRTVLATAAILCGQTSWSAIYEVGPGKTYRQPSEVTGRLNPGDTVRLDGGAEYAAVQFTRSGTRAAPIVLQGKLASDGRRAVIAGGVNTVHLRADWHVVEGVEITGGSSRCVFHEGADNVLRGVLVRDCPKQGVLGADQGSGNFTLEFSEVRNCGGGDRDHQIYMTTDQVEHPGSVFRLQHCYIHDANGGNNVKSRAERNEIRYNWIEGGYYHELELIGPDPAGVASGWSPRLKREDSDVLGNVFRKRRTEAGNDSNFAVFRIGGDGTGESHGRYRFANNTVIAGTGAVFRCFDSLETVEMHNNVFHRPGGGLNLMRTTEAQWTQGSARIAGANNWATSGAANLPAAWTGTRQGSDPGFRAFSDDDLRPAPGSPLINSGEASPQGPAGFLFPDPAFPPVFSPPFRTRPDAPQARSAAGGLDIGAFEAGDGLTVRRGTEGFSPRSGKSARIGVAAGTTRVFWRWEDGFGCRTAAGRACPGVSASDGRDVSRR